MSDKFDLVDLHPWLTDAIVRYHTAVACTYVSGIGKIRRLPDIQ